MGSLSGESSVEWAGRWQENSCVVCISKTVRNRKLTLYFVGTSVGDVGVQHHLDFTFDHAIVTPPPPLKSYLGYILETVWCRKLMLSMGIVWGCRYAISLSSSIKLSCGMLVCI